MPEHPASTPEEVVIAMQQARIDELEEALEEIAHRTLQRDLNQLAHQALGHQPNPHTLELLADEGTRA